jgi:hypothetical protein
VRNVPRAGNVELGEELEFLLRQRYFTFVTHRISVHMHSPVAPKSFIGLTAEN